MKKKIPLLAKLIIAIALGYLIGWLTMGIAPENNIIVKILVTFNGIFGNFLNFAIPLIIIGFIVPGIADLGTGAGKVLGVTAGFAYLSTICAGSLAYVTASLLFPKMLSGQISIESTEKAIEPFVTIDMPPIMGVMTALILAFVMGLGIAVVKGVNLQKCFVEFQDIVSGLIESIIIPLLPIHVMGIFANMAYVGTAAAIIGTFIKVFGVIIALHCIVLLLQYTVAGGVAGKNPFGLIKTMLPAYATAIGTQSSAATIPVTLKQTKLNGVSTEIADFAIPLCATIHLSGSTITLTCCSMAIMLLEGMPTNFGIMFPFILMLGVTMVAAPGVPGGAVMAALGLLQSMLGFSDAQASLMIALYLAQDSFGTACNVTGDGAIAILVDAIFGPKKAKAKQAQ